MATKPVRVWDLPIRLFHWLLVALIASAVITEDIGGSAIDWHGRIGVAILGLFAFRLAWGFIGSRHARFASFFPSVAGIKAYLRGEWRGAGHNPLGALSVFALLLLIGVQATTGLFANDDIAFEGPLARLVSKELSDQMTGIHKLSINFLMALIVLHLCAILFYALIRKEKLVRPMVDGWAEVDADQADAQTASGGGPVAFIVALLFALATVYAASGAWIAGG